MKKWCLSFIAACIMVGIGVLLFAAVGVSCYGWYLVFHGHPWMGIPMGLVTPIGALTVLIHSDN